MIKSFYESTRLIGFILFFTLLNSSSQAQNWLTSGGGNSNDEALDVASDAAGNYYTTGYYTSNATFGSTVLHSQGITDIFIAKYNSGGILQWAISAGGTSVDKATSIKSDKNGNIYVTGFYNGAATFGGTTINSTSNSQDVFVAKYTTTGNLIWVKTLGGANAETSYGITYDNIGNVIVTGQFKGTSNFGTTTLTSTTDPATGILSFDIFTTKLDANGNFLWTKQGIAKLDDRGLDVAVDKSNNIFVVGQFSDTITFGVTHNNQGKDAGYLMKYDASGNEQWFVKLYATQVLVNGVDVDKNNNPLITGDFQGVLKVYTNPVIQNTGSYNYNIFAAKFDNSGNLIWVDNDGSNSEVTSKSIVVDTLGNAYLAGLFKCRFDEYSLQYSSGIFYSSGYRDVFITKYSSSGQRKWFKQFGSNQDDYCSGIAIKTPNKPVIAGSFDYMFSVPFSPAFTKFNSNNIVSFRDSSIAFCSYLNYQTFLCQKTNGQKDAFITSPVDTLYRQAPFDAFLRNGNLCSQNYIVPCIDTCKDTVRFCGSGALHAYPNELFTYIPNWGATDSVLIGSRYSYNWSTGSNSYVSDVITNSGIYSLTTSREDGCFQSIDSIVAIINPIPDAPWITDSYNININQPPITKEIRACGKDTITLWGTHNTIADKVYWKGPSHTTINDSTIKVNKNGTYTYYVVSKAGCIDSNEVKVKLDTFCLSSCVLDPHIIFLDSILQKTDTIIHCSINDNIGVKLIDSVFYVINGDSIPFKTVKWRLYGPFGWVNSDSTYSLHYNDIIIVSGGSYTLSATLYNYCADSVVYPLKRVFYVKIYNPNVQGNIIGPPPPCAGDTIMLYATTNAPNYYWSGNNIITDYHDSIKVLVTNIPSDNTYYLVYSIHDSISGCNYSNYASYQVQLLQPPKITVFPADGIICPNDSALLTCDPGIKYDWYGPNGFISANKQSIYVNVSGFYFCVQTSANGCIQTSNTVELKKYNLPVLEAYPGTNLCNIGSSTTIFVQGNDTAAVHWLPPLKDSDEFLSGGKISQTVSTPGTYKCVVTRCGITSTVSVVITQSPVSAVITAADSIICLGDTLLLHANTGGIVKYVWQPQNINDSILKVTQAGTYTLYTYDASGCIGASKPFVVTTKTKPVAPNLRDTTICYGQSVTLTASSPYPVLWYNSPYSSAPIIHTGYTFTTPIITSNATFYAKADNSVCMSNAAPVNVNVYPTSVVPPIKDTDTICVGNPLILSAIINGANYNWKGPNGFTSNAQSFTINPVSMNNQGLYTQQYSSKCPNVVDSIYVTIFQLPILTVSGIDTICNNSPLDIHLTSNVLSSYTWNTTNNTNVFGESTTLQKSNIINDFITNNTNTDQTITYTITPFSGNGKCAGTTITHNINVKSKLKADFNYTHVPCTGQVTFTNTSSGTINNYLWNFGDGTTTNAKNAFHDFATGVIDTVRLTVLNTFGCDNYKDTILDFIDPLIIISTDTTICIQQQIQLQASGGLSYNWLPIASLNDPTTANPIASPTVTTTYTVTANALTPLGDVCPQTFSTTVKIMNPKNIEIGATTDKIKIMQGESTTIHVTTNPVLPVIWNPTEGVNNIHSLNPTVTPDATTTYTVSVLDDIGCPKTATVIVTVVSNKCENADIFVPNTFTPNGDANNDTLYVKGNNITELYFVVYNRWGQKVFETTDLKKGWDGIFNNEESDVAVFAWYIRAKCYNGNVIEKKGNVSLLR